MKIYPVILSGGSGSRLWPLSREARPKQFLPLVSDQSMLQETLGRVQQSKSFAAPMVICSDAHRFLVAEQLREMGIAPLDIILEPMGRNTAAAVAVAALRVAQDDPDGIILILPADHHIGDVEGLVQAIEKAGGAAEQGHLVTFGITPDSAHTGFGYIRQGAVLENATDVHRVERFVEKPDARRAEEMLGEGGWLWNSGIFIFPVKMIISEMDRLSPDVINPCREAFEKANRDLDFLRLDQAAFSKAESLPIDIAVMEKTECAAVVPVQMAWSDIGSWNALWDISAKDDNGNVIKGEVLGMDVKHSYIRSDGAMVTAIGVSDLIIVVDADVVLVADRNRAENVKEAVSILKDRGREEAVDHPLVFRPWGSFRTVDAGPHFKVKRITVNSGASLSLQRHRHRAEHWVVVSGTARVTCDDRVFDVVHNQSTYIPLGSVHRLENLGEVPLELIEVQTGDYLGEDDIERLEDDYGRNKS